MCGFNLLFAVWGNRSNLVESQSHSISIKSLKLFFFTSNKNPNKFVTLYFISSGYFVQDAADIILTGHAKGSWEFLLHHAVVSFLFIFCTFEFSYSHVHTALSNTRSRSGLPRKFNVNTGFTPVLWLFLGPTYKACGHWTLNQVQLWPIRLDWSKLNQKRRESDLIVTRWNSSNSGLSWFIRWTQTWQKPWQRQRLFFK